MSSPLTVQLDLAEFCEATDLSDVYVIEIVEHGILEPQGGQPKDWRFTDYELTLAKRAPPPPRGLGPGGKRPQAGGGETGWPKGGGGGFVGERGAPGGGFFFFFPKKKKRPPAGG